MLSLTVHAHHDASRSSSALSCAGIESKTASASTQGRFFDCRLQNRTVRWPSAVLPEGTFRPFLVPLMQPSFLPSMWAPRIGELASSPKRTPASMRSFPCHLYDRQRTQCSMACEYQIDGQFAIQGFSRHALQVACGQEVPRRNTWNDWKSPHLGTNTPTSSTHSFSRDRRRHRLGRQLAGVEKWFPLAVSDGSEDLSSEIPGRVVETPRAGKAHLAIRLDTRTRQKSSPQGREGPQVERPSLQAILPRQRRRHLLGSLHSKRPNFQPPTTRMRRSQRYLRLYESRGWQASYDDSAWTRVCAEGAQSHTRVRLSRRAVFRLVCEKQTRCAQPDQRSTRPTTSKTPHSPDCSKLLDSAESCQSVEVSCLQSSPGGPPYRRPWWCTASSPRRLTCKLILPRLLVQPLA